MRSSTSFDSDSVGLSSASLGASAKSPRSSASFARPIGSGRLNARPELLVVLGEHLGALVVLAPDVNRVVRAVELAHGAAGALLGLDHRDRHGDSARANDRRR